MSDKQLPSDDQQLPEDANPSDVENTSDEQPHSPEADEPTNAEPPAEPEVESEGTAVSEEELAQATADSAAEVADISDSEPAETAGEDTANTIGANELEALLAAGVDAGKEEPTEEASSTPSGVDQDDINALLAEAEAQVANAPVNAADADGSTDDIMAEMAAAIAAEQGGSEPSPDPSVVGGGEGSKFPASSAVEVDMPQFDLGGLADGLADINLIDDVELNVKIELGRTEMYVEDVLQLGVGSVVELDKLAGDPVDIFVNEQLVARGEVLVLNDNFCVRINELVSPIAQVEVEV